MKIVDKLLNDERSKKSLEKFSVVQSPKISVTSPGNKVPDHVLTFNSRRGSMLSIQSRESAKNIRAETSEGSKNKML